MNNFLLATDTHQQTQTMTGHYMSCPSGNLTCDGFEKNTVIALWLALMFHFVSSLIVATYRKYDSLLVPRSTLYLS